MRNKEILRKWISIKAGMPRHIDFSSFHNIFFPDKELSFVKQRYQKYTHWFTKLSYEKINEIILSILPDLSKPV